MNRCRTIAATVPFSAMPILGMAFFLVLCQSVQAQENFADNWPNFRGPTYNGTSTTASPPTEWSESKNVKWKIEIPGSGNNSSPIVWGDRVYVLTAIPQPLSDEAKAAQEEEAKKRESERAQGGDGARRRGRRGGRGGRGGRRGGGRASAPLTPTKFVTICYDRNTGDKVWEQEAVEATPHQGTHGDHSFASASPITDGKHIYSHFGSRGLYCYDMDGSLKWKRDDFGEMQTRNGFGEGSSPFLHQDTIIVPWDHEGDSYVIALDAKTGETKWKNERDEPSNWVTPVVVENDGASVVVTGGENYARAYELESGKELWKTSGFTSRPISAPVVHDDLVFLASSRGGAFLAAVKFGSEGTLDSNDGVAWSTQDSAPDVPSMMLSDGRVYFMKGSTNVINCLSAESGEEVFGQSRLPGISGVYSSLVAAGGKVIVVGRDGAAVVLEDSDSFKVLAENNLDDSIDATPALAGNQMFLRGKKFLYCIEAE